MSAPEVAESSSRARQEAEQEPKSEPPQRKCVALVSIANLLGNDDERAEEIDLGTQLLLDLNDPPLPSYLVLHPRVAPNPRRNDGLLSAYILAADRSAILLQVLQGACPDFFLCDTHRRNVTILPPVSHTIQASMRVNIRSHLSIGLIADPDHLDHYVVAQLCPYTSADHHITLLCYSTAECRWFTRALPVQEAGMHKRNPFSETGVLAHDDCLWWIALAYGVFFCNPCEPLLQLRFVPFPDDCETMDGHVAFHPLIRTLLDERRCVRPSEGKLRFVDIRSLSYNDMLGEVPPANPTIGMWTLDYPEGSEPWTFEYEVAFKEIWDNKTYADAGLLPGEVPQVALVDPHDHYVVYFFQGSKLFGLDMREKKVVACKECLIDRDDPQLQFRSSRPIVDAWELPPPPPPPPPMLSGDDYSSPDDNVWPPRQSYVEEMKRNVTQSVDSWLSQARLEWARDKNASLDCWKTWQMSPPSSSDEPSVESGGQADDELQFPLSP